MLVDHPVDPMLLATDLDAARTFYRDGLGLPVLIEDASFVTFGRDDNRVIVTSSTTGTADTATKVTWRVADLPAELAELRERGVAPQDFPDLGTRDGVADFGFAFAAWIEDPFGNSLQLLQMKGQQS